MAIVAVGYYHLLSIIQMNSWVKSVKENLDKMDDQVVLPTNRFIQRSASVHPRLPEIPWCSRSVHGSPQARRQHSTSCKDEVLTSLMDLTKRELLQENMYPKWGK